MTLNIGIIGAGRIGKVHAESLVTRVMGVKVLAIADVALCADAVVRTEDQRDEWA